MSPERSHEQVDVCIVGGGPAGLAAAIELRRFGVGSVVVIEREAEAGGIPRHANHIGFGMRDLRCVLSGPTYARRYVEQAARAGVDLRTAATVTDWAGTTSLDIASPEGLKRLSARAVVLATGCRERPRPARLVPGDRPRGVFTTGAVQQLVYLHRQRVGRRAVVVGAEHVSFSAVLTLAHGGAATLAMITEHPRHQTYAPFKWLTATRFGVPILTRHCVSRIIGRERVEAVEVMDLTSGATQELDCDTVVFTGDWVPDCELARRGGIEIDAATRAPRVDCGLRTSTPGVWGAGNLLHPAETADVAALGGRHAARAVRSYLESGAWPRQSPVPILCEPPVQWVSPSAIGGSTYPPRRRFVWRVDEVTDAADLLVRQGDRILHRQHHRKLVPTLPLYASDEWIGEVEGGGEPVRFQLEH